MTPEVTPALRMAGRGLLAAGALAAGAALGAVAERSLLRASGAPDPREFAVLVDQRDALLAAA